MGKQPPHVASLDDIARYAAQADRHTLFCRDLRHSWDELTSSVSQINGRYHQTVECRRCETLRVRIIDATTGAYIGSRYTYPDGYRLEGLGRISSGGNALLRLEAIHRLQEG